MTSKTHTTFKEAGAGKPAEKHSNRRIAQIAQTTKHTIKTENAITNNVALQCKSQIKSILCNYRRNYVSGAVVSCKLTETGVTNRVSC